MGAIEELGDDDVGVCPVCSKVAENKCTACKEIFYCNRECQRKHWKTHKFECKSLPYKIEKSAELGRYLVASRDLKEGEILFEESPLVVGPVTVTTPVCLDCYAPVDGSFCCRKSGWPLCGPTCEKAVAKNPEVVIPHQTEGRFEIENYGEACYLYEGIGALRALMTQKTAPSKYKKILSLESHLERRRGQPEWKRAQDNVVDVLKKTLGVMVFEALCPQLDFSDETIQKIVGIFDTNAIEIRLAASEVMALYEMACMLEHNCTPNIRMNFDEKYNITVRAGRDIRKGEHLSIMYTHSLWGTSARRDHLSTAKKFWCACPRCADPTEFGTHFSTLKREGHCLTQKNPLDPACPWTSKDQSISIPSSEVFDTMTQIGSELAVLQMKGTIDDYDEFLIKYESLLHPNHYHMLTAKHSLMQMLGRTEGYLIQDMDEDSLKKKEALCREMIALCTKLDPAKVRLQIYIGVSLYELHLPLLQYGKRAWENGDMSTEEFRKTLSEPHECLIQALDLLKDETHAQLPEGQLRLQVKDTLSQLEQFMKTVGVEMEAAAAGKP